MKKLIISTSLAIGLSVVATYGQGNIVLNNSANANANAVYSSSVTSGGLIFTSTTENQYGNNGGPVGSQLEYANFNLVILAGPSAGTCSQLIGVFLMSGSGGTLTSYASTYGYTLTTQSEPYTVTQDSTGGINADAGLVEDPNLGQFEIPGTLTSPGYLDLFIWEGTGSDYASAAVRGTSGVFAQPFTTGATPGLNVDSGMPDIILNPVPEPGTIALAGLGGLALLFIRRRS